jgi:hypothetical protein
MHWRFFANNAQVLSCQSQFQKPQGPSHNERPCVFQFLGNALWLRTANPFFTVSLNFLPNLTRTAQNTSSPSGNNPAPSAPSTRAQGQMPLSIELLAPDGTQLDELRRG